MNERTGTAPRRGGRLGATWSLGALLSCLAASCACEPQPAAPRATLHRAAIETLSLSEVAHRVWREGERRFVPPTETELAAMEPLVRAAMQAAEGGAEDLDGLAAPLEAAGFRVELWQVGPTRALALLERQHRGAGAYLFRVGAAPAMRGRRILQAPHAYHDLDTGTVAARLFFELELGDVLFTNTVHRYWSPEGDRTERPDAPADVCQQAGSFFHAATRAALGRSARLVQLHGFGPREGVSVDVVLSGGSRDGAGTEVGAVAAALGAAGVSVARFPEDLAVLGATTNEQGGLCRGLGASFLHVETSRALRQRLLREDALLRSFGAALWETPP
jgi:hypothetical protein